CVASFLCAQWNNIPKIERSTGEMARRWGSIHRFERADGAVAVACLPSPAALAERSEADLRACALGYRCRYLLETARQVASGEVDLEALRTAPYERALTALLRLSGIGRKVADCILLFALDKWEAFPVDVWIRRAMRRWYGAALARDFPGAAAPDG